MNTGLQKCIDEIQFAKGVVAKEKYYGVPNN